MWEGGFRNVCKIYTCPGAQVEFNSKGKTKTKFKVCFRFY